jgi:hypothetical protein
MHLASGVTGMVFRFVLLDAGCGELDPVVQFSHRKLAAEKRQWNFPFHPFHNLP